MNANKALRARLDAGGKALSLTLMHLAGIGGDPEIVAMFARADAQGTERGMPFSWAWGEGQVHAAITRAGADPEKPIPYRGTPRSLLQASKSKEAQTPEVFPWHEESWLHVGAYSGRDRVRAEPFDAVELELEALWLPQTLEPGPEPGPG